MTEANTLCENVVATIFKDCVSHSRDETRSTLIHCLLILVPVCEDCVHWQAGGFFHN